MSSVCMICSGREIANNNSSHHQLFIANLKSCGEAERMRKFDGKILDNLKNNIKFVCGESEQKLVFVFQENRSDSVKHL